MITDNIRLPLAVVVSLLVGVAGAGGTAAVAQLRITDTAAKVDKLDAGERDHDRRIQRVEDSLSTIAETLKEIKRDVKEVRRRGE